MVTGRDKIGVVVKRLACMEVPKATLLNCRAHAQTIDCVELEGL